MTRIAPALLVLVALALAACGQPAVDRPPATPTVPPAALAPTAPTVPPEVTATAAATEVAAVTPEREPLLDIRATRLRIPALDIDEPVQDSHEVPVTGARPAGCPAPPPGQTTLTVPERGIATPVESFEGLEHRAWIYGHSRWLGEPGLFFALQRIEVGDELFVDGLDRVTGVEVADRRFVVTRIYLSDIDAGGALVTGGAPSTEQVILQTSVRERGDNRPWIFDRATVMAKAEPVVDGDLDDRCKYLLLFVFAEAG